MVRDESNFPRLVRLKCFLKEVKMNDMVISLYFILQILDDYDPATQSAIRAMTDECEESTLREKNKYWKEDSSGNLAPPPEIGNSLCPKECSKNGLCINGRCICNEDFITADCSLKKGKLKSLIKINSNHKTLLRSPNQCFSVKKETLKISSWYYLI